MDRKYQEIHISQPTADKKTEFPVILLKMSITKLINKKTKRDSCLGKLKHQINTHLSRDLPQGCP